jgi:hypothetical protein
MEIFMYNSMEITSAATRRESVFLIHEDDSKDLAGEVERPEVNLVLNKNTAKIISINDIQQ